MVSLIEIQKDVEMLSNEDKEGLVAHLLASFKNSPVGVSDDEINERDIEMDTKKVPPISHSEFRSQVGR